MSSFLLSNYVEPDGVRGNQFYGWEYICFQAGMPLDFPASLIDIASRRCWTTVLLEDRLLFLFAPVNSGFPYEIWSRDFATNKWSHIILHQDSEALSNNAKLFSCETIEGLAPIPVFGYASNTGTVKILADSAQKDIVFRHTLTEDAKIVCPSATSNPTPTVSATPSTSMTHTSTSTVTEPVTPRRTSKMTTTPSSSATISTTMTSTRSCAASVSPSLTASVAPSSTARETSTSSFTPTPSNTVSPSASVSGSFSCTPSSGLSSSATPTPSVRSSCEFFLESNGDVNIGKWKGYPFQLADSITVTDIFRRVSDSPGAGSAHISMEVALFETETCSETPCSYRLKNLIARSNEANNNELGGQLHFSSGYNGVLSPSKIYVLAQGSTSGNEGHHILADPFALRDQLAGANESFQMWGLQTRFSSLVNQSLDYGRHDTALHMTNGATATLVDQMPALGMRWCPTPQPE
eukprot:gb/GECG01010552.1/.p1 GENE.gb/GECG01010552.1/~~gb/GECG01010552.1/.p1  ORF type:complete len:465 (+),score=29.87 gb/GECG01010552.1/:1-1395(+)